ncbi:MAG: peptide deformylase [Halanaerobiales bacterium]|nr:peptide deformylase [Halanaerobiales bacterium]
MAVKKIYQLGSDILRKKSVGVKKFDDQLVKTVNDLRDTLKDFQKRFKIGRAIAAPQIGVHQKIVYFNKDHEILMVNPEIVEKSSETFQVWDSCFSFKVSFFVKIERAKRIKVKYQDIKGNQYIKIFEDDLSELFQHEIDHLYGILATDRLKSKKDIIMREVWEERYNK